MALTDQAMLDYIAAHPGAGREDVRRTFIDFQRRLYKDAA